MSSLSSAVNYVLNLDSKQFTGSLNYVNFALRGFERSIGRSNPLLREFGTLLTLTGLSVLVDKIIEAGDSMNQLDSQLATMTNTMVISGKETLKQGEILDFLYSTANETGSQIGVLTKALNRMLPAAAANGISLADLEQTLVGVTGAMALAGATTEEKTRAFVAIGQVVGKNALQMEELRGQLGEALPTAMLITADGLTKMNEALGKTGEEAQVTISELNDLVASRAIDGAKFIQALKLGTESYVDIAKANVTLVESQYVRLANILERRVGDLMVKSNINTLLAATLSSANTTLDNYLAEMMGSADQFGRNFQTGMLDAIQGVGDQLTAIGPEIKATYSLVSNFLSLVVDGWNAIPPVVREVGLIVGLLFGAKGVTAIGLVTSSIGLLGQAWEDITKNNGAGIAGMIEEINTKFQAGTKVVVDNVVSGTQAIGGALVRGASVVGIKSAEEAVEAAKSQIEKDQAELAKLATSPLLVDYAAMAEKAIALENQIVELQEKRSQAAQSYPQDKSHPFGGSDEIDALDAKIKELTDTKIKLRQDFYDVIEKSGRTPFADPVLSGQTAKISDMLKQQAADTAHLAELTDDLNRRKQELAQTDAQAAAAANAAASVVAHEGALERLARFHDEQRDAGEIAMDAKRAILGEAAAFETLEEQALKSQIALQKSMGFQSQLNPQQQKGIKNLVEQLDTLGSATGEVRREFTTFNTTIDKIDDAMRSFDGGTELTSLLQQRAVALANAPSKEAEDKIKTHYDALALEMRSRFFKIMFGGGETDAVQAALNAANVAADRIASIDNVPKNKKQFDADVAARKAALKAENDRLAAMGIMWGDYQSKLVQLDHSAATAREDQANKAQAAELARIQKRTEAVELSYKAQEDALDAFIELQNKPNLGKAHLAEEKSKSKVGPYQTALGGFDAAVAADTQAQITEMNGQLTRLQAQQLQLESEALRTLREKLISKQAEIDLTTAQQKLEYETSDSGIKEKLDAELQAAQARQKAAEFELLVANQPGYDKTVLDDAKTAAEIRLRAAQAEYQANQDAGLRLVLAQLEGQAAKDKLQATMAEIELKSTPAYQSDFVTQAGADQTVAAIDLQNQLAAAQDANVLAGQRRVDQLQAQLDLQMMINEFTTPLSDQMFEGFVNGLQSGIQTISQSLSDVILGIQSVDDVFKTLLKGMIQGILEFFIQWALKWAVAKALEITGLAEITAAHAAAQATQTATAVAAQATQTSASVAAAGVTAAAWAPAAAATSVASYGTAALVGAAALAAIAATAATLFATGKFHDGGVAHDEMIAKLQKGELVVPNSHSAMAYGVLSSMGVPFGQMGAASAMGGPSAPSVSSASVSTDFVSDDMISNMGQGGSTIINVFDMSEVDKHLSRNPGAVINVVQNNKRQRGALSRDD